MTLEEEVLALVKKEPGILFVGVLARLGISAFDGSGSAVAGARTVRGVDRALQALRKARKIKFTRKTGWRPA